MLMLVVTIIIAAVVSTMAGGLFSTQSPAPTISANTEYSLSKGLSIDVLSTSEVIDTKDLKVELNSLVNGQRLSTTVSATSPHTVNGTGAGVAYTNREAPLFGNFALKSGVKMSGNATLRSSEGIVHDVSGTKDIPAAAIKHDLLPDQTPPDVTTWGSKTADQLPTYWKMHKLDQEHPKYYHMIEFNNGWTYQKGDKTVTYYPGTEDLLKAGDKVSVKIIYVPNGQTIYSSDVKVVS